MGEDDEVEVGGADGGRIEDIYGEDEVCKRDSGRDKKERLSSSGIRARVGAMIRTRLIEGDILRYPHPMGNRVVAAITLALRTVPKKNILN